MITALNADEQHEIAARRHRCALCGEPKQLTHEKISGGVPIFICSACAEDYVQRAPGVQVIHESSQKLLIFSFDLVLMTLLGIPLGIAVESDPFSPFI
ncbi:MAG: hypothetical protein JW945_02045 [Methanomicrobia archaeon]|nr:hypothetical protein [Methanomicrobia archaeon]